jgi:hypothetical protein
MRKRKIAIATLVSLALALAAALWTNGALAKSQASTTIQGTTLSFDVQFSPFFVLDFSSNGVREVTDISQSSPSIGDETVFQDQLLKSGKVVGQDGGTCTATHVDITATPPIDIACQVTFDLPRGVVATQGLASNAPVKHLVITGGTGAYLGATGEVTLTEFENNTGTVVFHFAD